ncbi:hypothetical protein I4U23_030814 [Adineta vaga]|nr:hypothetical protein I4U23_030814 [Adineta vaga]
MTKMHLLMAFVFILLINSMKCDENKNRAEIRARLAKVRSLEEALLILKSSGKKGRMSMITPDVLRKDMDNILTTARKLNRNGRLAIMPRNGGCEPRVICEPVPVDRSSGDNLVSVPQCLEVHRCGGCCQEGQFTCAPVEEKPVTFSPLLLVSLDDTDNVEVNRPLTLMNHTKCECKCSKTEEQCQREGKVLDYTLCQCIQPRCTPECLISATCSMIPGNSEPRCTCRRRLQGQSSNYCASANQRPNAMCTRCETVSG